MSTVIKDAIINNLGQDLSEIFTWFNEQPTAAASIAQVHHAMLNDNQEVANKVQICIGLGTFSSRICKAPPLSSVTSRCMQECHYVSSKTVSSWYFRMRVLMFVALIINFLKFYRFR